MRASNKGAQHQPEPSTEDTEVPEAAGTGWLKESKNKELAKAQPRAFNDQMLADIDSWDVAFSAANAEYGTIVLADRVLGNGFRIATEDDKRRLVGTPLMFLEWLEREGDFGQMVTAMVIQRLTDGGIAKWVVNDGSTGICKQLIDYTAASGRRGGLAVQHGLRESTYNIDAESGTPLTKQEEREYLTSGRKMVPAHTFYIDTSA